MPSATGTSITCLPANRPIDTFVSAATITAVARSISSAVKTFCAPPEPLVSTLNGISSSAALFFRASADMYVCAMPVGQAVTATTNGFDASIGWGASFCFSSSDSSCASINAKTSSFDEATSNSLRTSSFINTVDRRARAFKCMRFAPSSAAIMKKR